jgi:hypothetical protein
VTAKKVVDINAPRRAKRHRQGTGLSKAELEQFAAQERRLYEGLGQKEPDNFASGDMKKSLEESDDADEKQ